MNEKGTEFGELNISRVITCACMLISKISKILFLLTIALRGFAICNGLENRVWCAVLQDEGLFIMMP